MGFQQVEGMLVADLFRRLGGKWRNEHHGNRFYVRL